MYLLNLKNFLRSKSVLAALLLFLLIGLISILIGKQFLLKQEKAIQSATISQKEHIERNARYIKNDYGLLLYYLKFSYINKPSPITALAIGQRDVNANIQSLTIRGMEAQRYDTDLYNPYHLLIGNFDFSFVVIFLFPLLIIGFSFNLYSQEKEGGTWSLINIQTPNPFEFVLEKLSVRILTSIALLGVLLLLAKIIIRIPFDSNFISYALLSALYVLAWFSICLFVIALKKSTSISALLLLSTWLLFCLLIPGITNNYISAKYPVPQAYTTLLKQRDGYHTKWDENKDSTMADFYRHYPQFSHYKWTKSSFDYLWYYAMQQLGDEESRDDSKAMKETLRRRQQSSSLISIFFPPMNAQLQFTEIAGSGLSQHLDFLDSTAAFHERKKLYFYPKIFGALNSNDEQWEKHTPEYFTTNRNISWPKQYLPLIAFISILTFISLALFNKVKQ